jgi:nucleoside-diphosphate-sugar epimerase
MTNNYTEKLKEVVKGKLAIFIDAANLEQSVRDMWVNPKDVPDELRHLKTDELRWSVDYEKLKNRMKNYEQNIQGTFNIAKAAVENNLKRIIYASSTTFLFPSILNRKNYPVEMLIFLTI